MQFQQHARQLLAGYVKQRGVGEHAIEMLIRQIEFEEILLPNFATAVAVRNSRGEGQKPVSKAYKDNWNAIFAKKKKIIRRLLLPASLIYFCSAKPTDACLASAQRSVLDFVEPAGTSTVLGK